MAVCPLLIGGMSTRRPSCRPLARDAAPQKLHTVRKTWVLRPITWTAAALQTEANRRRAGRKRHSFATLWAREIPVSVTEIPVTLTVEPEPPALRPAGEGRFRAHWAEISESLTKGWVDTIRFATNCQNLTRHVGVICVRGFRRWISRAFSRLTSVKGWIAHSPTCTTTGTTFLVV